MDTTRRGATRGQGGTCLQTPPPLHFLVTSTRQKWRMSITDGEQRIGHGIQDTGSWAATRSRVRVGKTAEHDAAESSSSSLAQREKRYHAMDGVMKSDRPVVPTIHTTKEKSGRPKSASSNPPALERRPAQVSQLRHADRRRDDSQTHYVEVVYDGYVCIRAEPDLFSTEIGVVEAGDIVQVRGRATIGGISWLQLDKWVDWDGRQKIWKRHTSAWICEVVSGVQLVKKRTERWHPLDGVRDRLWMILSMCDVTVRSAPSSSAPIIALRKSREMLQVVETDREWIRLAQNSRHDNDHDQWVYIRSQTSSQNFLAAPLSEAETSTEEWEVVWRGGVSIRGAPSFKAPVIDGATHKDVIHAEGTVSFVLCWLFVVC
jgi:hypothetical protein